MQFRNDEIEGESKARWFKGVWVGVNSMNGARIILSEGGYEPWRSVSRLAESEQWSAEWVRKVRGIPWSRRSRVAKRVQAEAHPQFIDGVLVC